MDFVVQHAELVLDIGGQGMWRISVDVTHDNGETEKVAAMVPADAIEWRVAQFNVDPRTAAEMILVEPWARDGLHEQEMAPSRSAARALKAETVTEALAGGSITWAVGPPEWTISGPGGMEGALADSGDGDPLDTILEHSPLDEDIIAVKREALDMHRARRRRRFTTPVPPGATRAPRRPSPEELREHLLPPPPLEGQSLLSAQSEAQPSELAERVLGKRIEAMRADGA